MNNSGDESSAALGRPLPEQSAPTAISRLALGKLARFCEGANSRFIREAWQWRMQAFRAKPGLFARQILGSIWWDQQERVAREIVRRRRVAVKSGNGVGKTYLAADIALWFLYSHYPAVVLTTAPTARQVRFALWEEIRRRWRQSVVRLPGRLYETRIKAGDGWFALGLATDEGDKFQGFHAENLLIIFDEASGIPDSIWEAAEGVAVGENNKILAIGNPLTTRGRFYRVFQRANEWAKLTISALEHPNIIGRGRTVAGAVTRSSISAHVAEWCEPAPQTTSSEPNTENSTLETRNETLVADHSCPEDTELQHKPELQDTFEWEGRTYRPNNIFRARVLGQFPNADDDSLIPLRWIESAETRTVNAIHDSRTAQHAAGIRRVAADVARFGGDSTVIGLRIGMELKRMDVVQGHELMDVVGRIANFAYEERPESIAVDGIGMGAGVVDRLRELEIQGIECVNSSHTANNPERFANRRAELYYGLRERFRLGEIALPRLPESEQLKEELASIRYRLTSRGQIRIESKEEMKKRGVHSPDRADMLAMLFDSSLDWIAGPQPRGQEQSPSARLRAEMSGW